MVSDCFISGEVGESMPCVAQFGIIDVFEKDKDYSLDYEPQKYNCVAIEDDIINDWWNELTLIKTYFHCFSRPDFGLARWGVTLIPPESLEVFYSIVSLLKTFNRTFGKLGETTIFVEG